MSQQKRKFYDVIDNNNNNDQGDWKWHSPACLPVSLLNLIFQCLDFYEILDICNVCKFWFQKGVCNPLSYIFIDSRFCTSGGITPNYLKRLMHISQQKNFTHVSRMIIHINFLNWIDKNIQFAPQFPKLKHMHIYDDSVGINHFNEIQDIYSIPWFQIISQLHSLNLEIPFINFPLLSWIPCHFLTRFIANNQIIVNLTHQVSNNFNCLLFPVLEELTIQNQSSDSALDEQSWKTLQRHMPHLQSLNIDNQYLSMSVFIASYYWGWVELNSIRLTGGTLDVKHPVPERIKYLYLKNVQYPSINEDSFKYLRPISQISIGLDYELDISLPFQLVELELYYLQGYNPLTSYHKPDTEISKDVFKNMISSLKSSRMRRWFDKHVKVQTVRIDLNNIIKRYKEESWCFILKQLMHPNLFIHDIKIIPASSNFYINNTPFDEDFIAEYVKIEKQKTITGKIIWDCMNPIPNVSHLLNRYISVSIPHTEPNWLRCSKYNHH